jgi:hypothetical protein
MSVLAGALFTITPSSSGFAAMVIVPKIIESEAIQKDLPDIYKSAVEKLKESLK